MLLAAADVLQCAVAAARGAINYLQDMSPSLPSLSMGRGRQVSVERPCEHISN